LVVGGRPLDWGTALKLRGESSYPALLGTLLVLSGIVALALSGQFIGAHLEGRNIWTSNGVRVVTCTVNSTVPEVNVTIDAHRLDIHYFNTSGNSVSIMVVKGPDSTVILNYTRVSGENITGIDSPDNPPVSDSYEPYVVSLHWEGVDTTVSFSYEGYWNWYVDSLVTVTMPGYSTLVTLGQILLVGGAALSMVSLAVRLKTRQ